MRRSEFRKPHRSYLINVEQASGIRHQHLRETHNIAISSALHYSLLLEFVTAMVDSVVQNTLISHRLRHTRAHSSINLGMLTGQLDLSGCPFLHAKYNEKRKTLQRLLSPCHVLYLDKHARNRDTGHPDRPNWPKYGQSANTNKSGRRKMEKIVAAIVKA